MKNKNLRRDIIAKQRRITIRDLRKTLRQARKGLPEGSSHLSPEDKALWIAALRSGQFRQGKFCLQPAKDTYCCLGVLNCLVPEEKQADPGNSYLSFLPKEIQRPLAGANDLMHGADATNGWLLYINKDPIGEATPQIAPTFHQLARVIEEEL